MIHRFYADNFRCLLNFELELGEANVFLGVNGSGKTSVLTILKKIQDLIVLGSKVGEVFPARDLPLAQDRNEQRFEIEARIDGGAYRYALVIEHDLARGRMRIFDQLSDGQRALIALYGLIFLREDRRVFLFIDEPDNYLTLREIQPWLAAAVERCGASLEQIVVVSHHPVMIDYMAGAGGRWFSRHGDGPVRASTEPRYAVDGLSLSETVARGWEG